MDKIIVFQSFYNPIEANIVKARLLDSGVQCFLSDEITVTINPIYNQALGGVKLHLFERDVELANSILQMDQVQEPVEKVESGVMTCPNCGSSHLAYVQATKNRFNIFTIIISILFSVYPFHVKKAYHCFDCQYEFK